MIEITDKSSCSGCTACYASCPKQCISMVMDDEGFRYPKVDKKVCIDCGICEKVCPIRKPLEIPARETEAYAIQHKNEEIRAQSASGGAFTAIATEIIKKRGVVYGGTFDKDFKVCHQAVESEEELSALRCSKYVQSDLRDIFRDVQTKLKENRLVLFSGTPCQVYGLLSFLRKKYDNLIALDLVCHGTPSPGLWDMYLRYHNQKHNGLGYVSFRDKHFGYAGSSMALGYKTGYIEYMNRDVQFFKHLFFNDINSRPSCFHCHFKTVKRQSDITLYDCWHVNVFDKRMDDDKGTTMMLIHSEQGKRLFNDIKSSVRYCQADVDTAIRLDGCMATESTTENPKRTQFFADARIIDYKALVNKYFPLTMKKRIVNIIKPLLYRTGLLKKLKRIIS